MPRNNETFTSEIKNGLDVLQMNYYSAIQSMEQQELNDFSNISDYSSDYEDTAYYDPSYGYQDQNYWAASYSDVLDELEFSSDLNSGGYSVQPSLAPSVSGYQYLNDFFMHEDKFQDTLSQIERYQDKKALDSQRSSLALELKGFEQLTEQLESSYSAKKVKFYSQTNAVTSFFSSAEPSQSRLDSISKIQNVVKLVRDDLISSKVQPALFNIIDPVMAMKYQVHHLEQAILAIKGAALNEFSKISDSYKVLQPSSRSAMHVVLQSTYNCEQMPAQEKVDAKFAFSKFESKLESQQRMEDEASKEQPRAFVV